MNEKLRTFSMARDWIFSPTQVDFFSSLWASDTRSAAKVKEIGGKMNIFKCRCLSLRFIFIHFTNTKEKS